MAMMKYGIQIKYKIKFLNLKLKDYFQYLGVNKRKNIDQRKILNKPVVFLFINKRGDIDKKRTLK